MTLIDLTKLREQIDMLAPLLNSFKCMHHSRPIGRFCCQWCGPKVQMEKSDVGVKFDVERMNLENHDPGNIVHGFRLCSPSFCSSRLADQDHLQQMAVDIRCFCSLMRIGVCVPSDMKRVLKDPVAVDLMCFLQVAKSLQEPLETLGAKVDFAFLDSVRIACGMP